MNGHFIWNAVRKDLLRRFRDPVALLIWAGIPLLVGALMALTMGGDSASQPTARLVIVDQDDSFLSRFLSGALQQGPLAEIIQLEPAEDETLGLIRVREGSASGLLIIPEGFGEAVLGERSVRLRLFKNPAQRILPEILEETLDLLVDAIFYGNQLLGSEMQQIAALTNDQATPQLNQITTLSAAIFEKVSEAGSLLSPPLLEVQLFSEAGEETASSQEPVPVALLFFPGILLMGVLLTSQGMSEDLWKERDQGTLRRQLTSPAALRDILTAKLLASGLLVATTTGPVLLLGGLYLAIPLLKLPFALFWLGLSGLAFSSLMFFLQILMPSKRAGILLTSLLIFPLMMAGGSFFPFEAMPAWMARLGRWTPNGILLEQLKAFFLDRIGAAELLTAVILLLLVATALAVCSNLAIRRFAAGAST